MKRRAWLTTSAAGMCVIPAATLMMLPQDAHRASSSPTTTVVHIASETDSTIWRKPVALPKRVEPPVVRPVSTTTVPKPPVRTTPTTEYVPVRTVPPTTEAPVRAQVVSGSGVWSCIAYHESGGNPATNTGNGFYGAFQFTLSTWQSAGGGPGLPSSYSYSTQLAVAERVQQQQGWGAWPNTSRMCGV